jgi:hypothetical protein
MQRLDACGAAARACWPLLSRFREETRKSNLPPPASNPTPNNQHKVWEGKGVVATGRKMIGATNPLASEPGTIRGDFAVEVGRNVIHGSDSVENAQKEIALWFGGAPFLGGAPFVFGKGGGCLCVRLCDDLRLFFEWLRLGLLLTHYSPPQTKTNQPSRPRQLGAGRQAVDLRALRERES